MEANIFVKNQKAKAYNKINTITFSTLPRINEFVSLLDNDVIKYYQVIAIHHSTHPISVVEIYAFETEPTWELRNTGSIGFAFK